MARAISPWRWGPDTAIRLDNLAVTYWNLGRHADALPLQQRAEQIRQRHR